MVRIRRIAVVAVLCALTSAYATGSPAHADTPEVFGGSALARGLNLDILGTKATLGHADTTVKSALSAAAKGAGQLLSASEVVTSAPTASGALSDVKPRACMASVPLGAVLVDIDLACGVSSASVANGLPIATATGEVASVVAPASGVLGSLLSNLAGTIDDLVGGLLNQQVGSSAAATAPVLGLPVGGVTNNVLGTVNGLLNQVQTTAEGVLPDPLKVKLGESTSSVKTEVGKVTSLARGRGAEVTLLPLPTVAPKGLAQIIVGDASAAATYDRATGAATAAFDPALLRLSVLGVDVPIAPNQDITILAGTPLESTIKLATGKTYTTADGGKGAVADAVSLHLLKGLNGGVLLELAHAEAVVAGKPEVKVAPQREVPRVTPVAQLPRTGGSPVVPAVGIAVLTLALVGRRIALRSR